MTLDRVAEFCVRTAWSDFSAAVQERAALLVLDTIGVALVGRRYAHRDWTSHLLDAATGPVDATVWGSGASSSSRHAALINATVAHHLDWDDGNPRASVHGGATIVPAALACAEATGAAGRDFLASLAIGYAAAVACGRPLLPGIERHGLHPPAINGVFGAAAAAARLQGATAEQIGGALTLAGVLAPVAPFHAFTSGAPVKDLYAGWPAFLGVTAAELALGGIGGPATLFSAPEDGLGQFLLHEPCEPFEPDPDELLHVAFKAYPSCRATHMALTALEPLLPVSAVDIREVTVETYAVAAGLSADANAGTPIGAKVSLPFSIASMLLDGALAPDAFAVASLRDPARVSLAARVNVREVPDDPARGGRWSRVTLHMRDGSSRSNETHIHKWSAAAPATRADIVGKYRGHDLPGRDRIIAAVERLSVADSVDDLIAASVDPGQVS